MQALSVRQPWAWAIARGHTGILNRVANTGYRGPVAIYASAPGDPGARGDPGTRDEPTGPVADWNSADPAASTGGIVAVVSLVGVCTAAASGRPCRCGQWASTGQYHWRVADPWPLRWPVIALSHPGLWELTPVVAAGVARLLPGQAGPPHRVRPARPPACHRRRAVHPLQRPN